MKALAIGGLSFSLITVIAIAPAPRTFAQSAAPSVAATSPPHPAAAIAPDVTQRANQAAAVAVSASSDASSPHASASAAAMNNLPEELGGSAPNPEPTASVAKKKTITQKVKAVVKSLSPARLLMDREYKKASAAFPAFCKNWQDRLHQREVNNLQHIAWRFQNGFETALYTGYSTVESCEAHESAQGFAIGKLSYEEYHYLIKAKDEADEKTAKATPVDDTHTTEIFRWDKGRWFDFR